MTLGELIIILHNIENIGADRGQPHGPSRRIVCRVGDGTRDIAEVLVGDEVTLFLKEYDR